MIRRFGVEPSAGAGRFVDSHEAIDTMAFNAQWLSDRSVDPHDAARVRLQGVSMEPGIPDGALVLPDFDARLAFSADVHVFTLKDGIFCQAPDADGARSSQPSLDGPRLVG